LAPPVKRIQLSIAASLPVLRNIMARNFCSKFSTLET
jgi:hypothetical protein